MIDFVIKRNAIFHAIALFILKSYRKKAMLSRSCNVYFNMRLNPRESRNARISGRFWILIIYLYRIGEKSKNILWNIPVRSHRSVRYLDRLSDPVPIPIEFCPNLSDLRSARVLDF